jgi:hypothetical protein
MLADIHQQRDRLLSPDLLDDEKMELIPVDVGPEVILADGEPKWNLVWGVIVDRSAASIRDNARKLRKMAREIRNTVAERAGMQPVLFLVPGGNGETPPPLAEFKKSFRVFNVPDSTFLITLAAITLVEDSQVSDSEVARWMRRTL